MKDPAPQVSDFAFRYRYPYPIASVYHRYRIDHDPVRRCGFLLGTFKAWLKFCAAVAACDYLAADETDPTLDALLSSFRRPSLGQWNELWREVSRWFTADAQRLQASFVPEVHTLYHASSGRPTEHKKAIDGLIALRNHKLEHDSPPPSPGKARELQAEMRPEVLRLLGASRFLGRYRFGYFMNVRASPPEHTALWYDAVGPHLTFEPLHVRTSEPQIGEWLCLADPSASTRLLLHPWFLLEHCPECQEQHQFCLDRVGRKGRLIFKSYLQDHALEEQRDADGRLPLGEAWQRLLGRELGASLRAPMGLDASSLKRLQSRAGQLGEGRRIGDRYELRALIKTGGMGQIYRARDHLRDTDVALKILLPRYAQDQRLFRRFLREARVLARLRHPNVVAVDHFDSFEDEHGETRAYLAMEFVEGLDLEERSSQHGPLPWATVTLLLTQLAPVLDMLHARKMVHRDIKPSNIIIDADGQVKLVDFGLVHDPSDPLSQEGDVMGTEGFMAPEQRQARGDIGPWTDVFGLAATAVRLLTGERPYELPAARGVQLPEGLPPAVVRVLRKALSLQPARRHESVGQFVGELCAAFARAASDAEEPAPEPDPAVYETLPPTPDETAEAHAAQSPWNPAGMVGQRFCPYIPERLLHARPHDALFLATHVVDEDQQVLLQVPRTSGTDSAEVLERFREEIRTLQRIHKNGRVDEIIGLHGADGDAFPYPWMAAELLKGTTLALRLEDEESLPLAEALDVGAAVLRGLEAAHRAGIVHRDLSPESVFLGLDGRVQITGFGAARQQSEDLTVTGELVGAPFYMSPEQIDGRVDSRGDLYSFGALLFHMLAGRPPFASESLIQVVSDHLESAPPRASAISDQEVPADLDELIDALLAKDPRRRPSARACLERIAPLLTPAAPKPKPVPPAPATKPAPPQRGPRGWTAEELLGTTLGGWSLERVIGRGNWGAVYYGKQGDREAAIKVPRVKDSSEAAARFRAEIAAMLAVHPAEHVVGFLGSDADGPRPWLATEYIAGANLGKLLNSNDEQLPLAQVLDIADGLFAALEEIHAAGLIHRDVKPDNVFLAKDGSVRLGDFGIVHLPAERFEEGGITRQGALLGTPTYMSPEQCRGEAVDPRSDLYAAGVLLYRLLTGVLPLTGATVPEIVRAHLEETPAPVSEHDPLVPPELDLLAARLLAKTAGERPEDATACRTILARVRTLVGGGQTTDTVLPVAIELQPGDRLDTFTIERELGRGGMGITYAARDPDGRRFALKVAGFNFTSAEKARDQLRRDADNASRVPPHPAVSHIYGLGECEVRGVPVIYLRTEHVAGPSLSKLLTRTGALPAEVVRHLWVSVTEGLADIHQAGVLHLDLKPSNILLDREIDSDAPLAPQLMDAVPKIIDFGISRSLGEVTDTSTLEGTPFYMSPEQCESKTPGVASDIYTLGCTFFHVATGSPPFSGEQVAVIHKQVTAPPPIAELPGRLGYHLSLVLSRCLAKAPGARYASADALLEDLCLAGGRSFPRRELEYARDRELLELSGKERRPKRPSPSSGFYRTQQAEFSGLGELLRVVSQLRPGQGDATRVAEWIGLRLSELREELLAEPDRAALELEVLSRVVVPRVHAALEQLQPADQAPVLEQLRALEVDAEALVGISAVRSHTLSETWPQARASLDALGDTGAQNRLVRVRVERDLEERLAELRWDLEETRAKIDGLLSSGETAWATQELDTFLRRHPRAETLDGVREQLEELRKRIPKDDA